MNKSLAVAVVALGVAVVGLFYPGATSTVVKKFGSSAGQDHSFMEFFHGGLADGGDILASSTPGDSTLLASNVMKYRQFDHTLNTQSGTLTLPASTTLAGWLPSPGDTREILIRNATTTSSINLTIAVGTGMTLKNAASSTPLLIGDTDGKNTMFVKLVRQADRSFNVYMQKYQD